MKRPLNPRVEPMKGSAIRLLFHSDVQGALLVTARPHRRARMST